MRDRPRPTRSVAESLGGRPCSPPADPTLAATTPTPQRTAGRGGGPAYRDVRNALLALVRHGPLWCPRPGWWTCGLSIALYGCLWVPLPAGAVKNPRRDEKRDGSSALAAAHAPAAPALGPRAAAPAASTARLREEGGRRREGEGGRRVLQTDSSSRRRGAELYSPLSAGTRKRFFSDPHPTPPPALPQPPSLTDPPPSAQALGWIPASLSQWVRVGFQGSFKSQRRPSDGQRRRCAAPRLEPPRNSCVGEEVWAGTEDPPKLLPPSRLSTIRLRDRPLRSLPQTLIVHS